MSRQTSPNSRASRYWPLALIYLVLIAAWSWRLHSEPAPVDDPQRAVRLERLTKYLLKAPPETAMPILFSIALISDERLAHLDAWLQNPPLQQLRELTVQETPLLKNSGTLRDSLLLGWLGQSWSGSAAAAFPMITAAGDRLDDTMRLYALEQLAIHAQQEGDQDTAMSILQRASDLPTSTWKTVRSYVQTARRSNHTAAALGGINDWIARRGSKATKQDLEEAREVQVAIMLRLNRADDALAAQIDQLKAAPSEGPLPSVVLDRALVCARACGQTIKLVPWLERQLSTYTEHSLTPAALLGKADLHSDYRHWLTELAAISDRELPASRAFEPCLRLAALGERSALSRVCLLAEPAKKRDAALAFLQQLIAIPAHRITVLELAQTDALAQRTVSEALRTAPDDRDLHFAATLATAAVADSGSATLLWQSYLRRFPTDLPAQRRLIQAHLQARQPDLALRVYQSMDPKNFTDSDRRQQELISQL